MNQITNITIDWMEGFCNAPKMALTFDELSFEALDDTPWELSKINPRMVRRQAGIFVGFHSITDSPKSGGYGESRFDFKMADGTMLENKGAWSSRPSMSNMAFPELDHCIDVVHRKRYIAFSVTVNSICEWLRANPNRDWTLARVENGDGIYHEVLRKQPDGSYALKNSRDTFPFIVLVP